MFTYSLLTITPKNGFADYGAQFVHVLRALHKRQPSSNPLFPRRFVRASPLPLATIDACRTNFNSPSMLRTQSPTWCAALLHYLYLSLSLSFSLDFFLARARALSLCVWVHTYTEIVQVLATLAFSYSRTRGGVSPTLYLRTPPLNSCAPPLAHTHNPVRVYICKDSATCRPTFFFGMCMCVLSVVWLNFCVCACVCV